MTKGVFKEVAKLNKIPHPKSRKTAQLTRKAIRSAAREKLKNVNFIKQNIVGEKFLWFKERIDPNENITASKVLELIERYLGRFDEELEQIQLKHTVGQRKGRQHASREDVIKMTKNRELNEFNTCGIEMPDLLNPKQLSMLMKWEGELRFLQNFKIVRFSRSRLENLKLKECEKSSSDVVEEDKERDISQDMQEDKERDISKDVQEDKERDISQDMEED